MVGRDFGRYRLLHRLGTGGMGEVYCARDDRLERDVALKILPPGLLDNDVARRRFRREALALSKINHPNIATIFDFDTSEGIDFLAMELVAGVSLSSRVSDGPLPESEVIRLGTQLAEGLAAAHAHGVIHRDLKPANLMLTPEGRLKILDFGLAYVVQPQTDLDMTRSAPVVETVTGTLPYMPPELLHGQSADARGDIYSAGAVLYELLTGERPFSQSRSAELIGAILYEAPAAPGTRIPNISAGLERVILKALDKDPAHRYQSAGELLSALETVGTRQSEAGMPPAAGPAYRRGGGWHTRMSGGVLRFSAALLVGALATAAWWSTRQPPASTPPDPVSVLIADLQNSTGDTIFDRTLEPVLRIALEGAEFITAYDRSQLGRALGVRAPDTFDQRSARELAIKQGVSTVVSGVVERDGGGYNISLTATQAVTGTAIATAANHAANKDSIVRVASELAMALRTALGDDTSDLGRRFARETLSVTSLDAVHEWAHAQLFMADGNFEEARTRFARAVSLDPKFGIAYAGMGMASRNLGQQQEAEAYAKEALRHIDGMTERERYRTRGAAYAITGDYQACVKEYGVLVTRYSGDAAARNNFALCSTYLRDIATARDEMRRAVEILPRRALYRVNLALFSAYGGDFGTAEREARMAGELGSALGSIPLAFAQVAQGRLVEAAQTYESFRRRDSYGASVSASGLGDLAAYEGRFSEAARILGEGAATDLALKAPDRAAAKFVALANVQLSSRQNEAAIETAKLALKYSPIWKNRFLVARVFVEAAEVASAGSLTSGLASESLAEPRAYAKIVEGNIALRNGDPRLAIRLIIDANALLDTWIGHFDLGRAYLAAGEFTQAESEFDRCLQRRGEVLALFLDEEPTYSYLPPVYYYRGRVQEALNDVSSADSYRAYLAIRANAGEDPVVDDVRKRASR